MEVEYLIIHLSQLASLAPALAGAIFWSKLHSFFKWIVGYSFLCVLLEAFGYLSSIYSIPNLFVIPFYGLVQYFLLSFPILKFPTFSALKTLLFLSYGFILFVVVEELRVLDFSSFFTPISICIESVFLLAISFYYFHKSLTEPNLTRMVHRPLFWFFTAIVTYFGLTLFYFLTYNVLNIGEESDFAGAIHGGINFIYYVLLLISILWSTKFKVQ